MVSIKYYFNRILFIPAAFVITTMFANAQVLDPVEWDFSAEVRDENRVDLVFKASIEENWHMYGMQIPEGGPIATSIIIEADKSFEKAGSMKAEPEPVIKYDKTFKMEIGLFSDVVVFKQAVKRLTDDSFIVSGIAEYMVCDDQRCLPPEEIEFTIFIPETEPSAIKETKDSEEAGLQSKASGQAEPVNDISDLVIADEGVDPLNAGRKGSMTDTEKGDSDNKDKTLWGIFLVALLGGLGGILTPCVYPMIPLTVSFFMRGKKSRAQTLYKGLFFGLSIIAIYTFVGLLAGLTRIDLANAVSTHWLPNVFFFLIFILLAFSFFGLYEIILPGSLANRVDQKADKGGLLGPFFMALATAIISFSCTGPIVGILLGSAMQGEVLQPVVGMFGFGLSFSLPFTLLAIFPGMMGKLPKSGGWLNAVKVFIAFIMLAFSLIFIVNISETYNLNILGRNMFLSLWIVMFTLLGFYLLGKFRFARDPELKHISVSRLIAVIITFTFVMYLFTGLLGAPLRSLASFLPTAGAEYSTIVSGPSEEAGIRVSAYEQELCGEPKYADFLHLPHGLQGYFEYNQALACAKELDKPLFIDFAGHSCKNCKQMYGQVWSDPDVQSILAEDFIIVALYTDDKTRLPGTEWVTSSIDGRVKKTMGRVNKDIQISKFGSNALPMYAIVDGDGNMLTEEIYVYNTDVDDFIEWLKEGKQ